MNLYEWRRSLRASVARRDPEAIVAAVSALMPEECLQAVGGALLKPMADGVAAAAPLATHCVARLSDRNWDGDEELLADLESTLAREAASPLRPVPVDLEALAEVLEEGLGSDPGMLDLETGEVWSAVAVEYAREADDPNAPPEPDAVRWLEVEPEGSDEAYRDMRHFIGSVEDPVLGDRLSHAIQGKGAFRRFRDTLEASPKELTRWQAFSDDRKIGRARAWLAHAGLRPTQRSSSATT